MFKVKKSFSGRGWDVVVKATGDVVEGGFFSRSAAEASADQWERDYREREKAMPANG